MNVNVTRGPLVESVHAVAACAVDVRGRTLLAHGDVDSPVFVRSAAKPFIAAAVVLSGAADWFGFDERELAVIAASHNGEPFHVETVRGILAKAGLSIGDLQCGAHSPAYDPAARALAEAGQPVTAIHNNCSGKHAGILAMCVHLGFERDGYLAPEHPAQEIILAFCARMVDEERTSLTLGVDGCGIPVFATSLRRAALAFARLATLEGLADADARALERVRGAMAAQPRFVAGTGRLDTAIMETTGGRIVCKAGAEGVHGDALLREGLGLAMKVLDGTRRAAAPAVISLLTELGALEPAEREALGPFATQDVRNVAGRVVGRIEAAPHARPDSDADTMATTAAS
jgi:L-asparaginase II